MYNSLTFGKSHTPNPLLHLTRPQACFSPNWPTLSLCPHLHIALRSTLDTTARSYASSPGWAPFHCGGLHSVQKSSSRYVRCGARSNCLISAQIWEEAHSGTRFVRVFHEGTVFRGMEWVRLDEFVRRLRALVPAQLFKRCMGT